MSNIFYRGQFNRFRISDLNRAQRNFYEKHNVINFCEFQQRTAVFLSHKHSDLDDMKGVIGMLEKLFNVDVYIDSMDEEMPKITSGETANRIKQKIANCNRFILLATDDAIESKWCNWELGIGDALKSNYGHLALFPMKENQFSSYAGNEYLEIYPHIFEESGLYMVKNKQKPCITTLHDWLLNK